MKSIYESVDLGGITVKNRLVRSATQEVSADENGNITATLLSIYENLALGGIGTIITSMVGVDENSRISPKMIKTYGDDFVSGFSLLAEKVHRHDCKIIVQLSHCGAKALPDNGGNPLAPSEFQISPDITAKSMTQTEIQSIIESFAKAAKKCKEAGADGVQLHAAHGYLLSQFLSPYFNKRLDKYGGELANRAQMLFEVYATIRAAVGDKYPIYIKINSEDKVDGGLTADECIWICKELENRGLNGIEVSGGLALSRESTSVPKNPDSEGIWGQNTLKIAEKMNIAVISVGGYRTPEMIESWLNKGNIEAVSLCRPLISEPDLPNRWKAGDRTRPRCISCNKCFKPEGGFGCKVFP